MSVEKNGVKEEILAGQAVLGIEFGSTRIKAVLIDSKSNPVASGSHEWENSYIDGIWTYSLEEVWSGVRDSYQDLLKDVKEKYDVPLTSLGAIGISGMMHGYLAFDKEGKLLAPFRTWRNSTAHAAAAELTKLFDFNIPERWSISHLYQSMQAGADYLPELDFQTTLAGYVHWKLTGKRVLGIGDAAGMFPIDSTTNDFDQKMAEQFDSLVAQKGYPWKLRDVFPQVMVAGEDAGVLTAEGAKLLDVSGQLMPGIPMCAPEGDAGTGMVATNSVAERTGNVSAGTSVFAMIVLEEALSKMYPEIDMVTTPSGAPVAMAHCNNCTSDLNAWVGIFREFAEALGVDVDMNQLFGTLYNKALEGDAECGGLLAYNYFSGEGITEFEEGRPLFVRTANSKFNLANFMRVNLFTSVATLKLGMDILMNEGVKIDRILGHGGLFKTKGVGQGILAAAIDTPVSVMETAGEGGAWGIALLAAYRIKGYGKMTLAEYLEQTVFAGNAGVEIAPDPKDVAGFNTFMERYTKGLAIERAAVENL